MSGEESFVEKLQRQSKEKLQKLKKEKQKRPKKNNNPTFCIYNLGLQKEVCHFHLLFILLLLKDLVHYQRLLKQLK
jgi:hypothetical protein